ncbi:hypothetical protein COLAER_00682 [Collinsella aerofaciens ATCC 25986]|uniref:Uncharacterized protein n=1 Tax=Collinsella aerofaciens (strain ATCC 25986 / DSM 3979 / JCM 10188 / KCTC 3647 / NCTC 11838 / VPI 1003) TaxID=411903 RepID=A4E8E2_COLAA|nr:hypothetical protein COLAER_00682 [Collinsella aerofaciens ATCC 25986]
MLDFVKRECAIDSTISPNLFRTNGERMRKPLRHAKNRGKK